MSSTTHLIDLGLSLKNKRTLSYCSREIQWSDGILGIDAIISSQRVVKDLELCKDCCKSLATMFELLSQKKYKPQNVKANHNDVVTISAKLIREKGGGMLFDCEGQEEWFPASQVVYDGSKEELAMEPWLFKDKFPKEAL